ncbi:MAG: polyamine aminopropyltransferase [Gammaproteobacteria bacterium]|nr:polyamine aminopropyltransferase [Gammaproteobacteria bacterium]
MKIDKNWFTETNDELGIAFSLKIKQKLFDEQSPYQRIEVYETETFGNLMVIDGYVMLTDRDNFIYHEMMSHPVLFTHDQPERVAIIGGGDCGTLREVLKHKEVKQVWQIDIDELVTRASPKYFPKLCGSNNDPRAAILFGDGIEWIKNAEPDSLDIIIVDSTDPIGPAAGLFTEAFFRDCYKALRTGGILIQQSESPLLHMESIIKPMHDAMRAAGYSDTASLHFFQCSYPSGWWTATMACKKVACKEVTNKEVAHKDSKIWGFRESDADNRCFQTLYYNTATHKAAFAKPEFFRKQLAHFHSDG